MVLSSRDLGLTLLLLKIMKNLQTRLCIYNQIALKGMISSDSRNYHVFLWRLICMVLLENSTKDYFTFISNLYQIFWVGERHSIGKSSRWQNQEIFLEGNIFKRFAKSCLIIFSQFILIKFLMELFSGNFNPFGQIHLEPSLRG